MIAEIGLALLGSALPRAKALGRFVFPLRGARNDDVAGSREGRVEQNLQPIAQWVVSGTIVCRHEGWL